MRYELDDFREIAPAIWMPFRILRTIPSQRLVARFDVHEISINDVSDGQFVFNPKAPGTLIRDRDTDAVTEIPGGLDLLDETTERVRNFATNGNLHRGGAITEWSGIALAAFGFGLGVAIRKSVGSFRTLLHRCAAGSGDSR